MPRKVLEEKQMIEVLLIKHGDTVLPIRYNGPNIIKDIKKSGYRFYEIYMLKTISSLPYRRGVCLDIGANTGNHTVFFSRFCNFDEVWAYEPDPESFALLQENVENNTTRTVRTFNVAIGAKREFRRMTNNKENPSRNKLTKAKGKTLVIPITTNLKVALMKIDVEGHELEVIKGAYEVIEREKPELFIEWHDGHEPILNALPKGYRYVKTFNNAPSHHFTAQ